MIGIYIRSCLVCRSPCYYKVYLFNIVFIVNRAKMDGQHKWFKFDDGDVCECNMDDDEVLFSFIICYNLSVCYLSVCYLSVCDNMTRIFQVKLISFIIVNTYLSGFCHVVSSVITFFTSSCFDWVNEIWQCNERSNI